MSYNKKYHKKYYQDHKEKCKKYNIKYCKEHPEERRILKIKYTYGLSYEDWFAIWESQDGRCAICSTPFSKPSSAHVDHNHKTGGVRGLLCPRCNLAIGLLNDDPELMTKAIKYLKKGIN